MKIPEQVGLAGDPVSRNCGTIGFGGHGSRHYAFAAMALFRALMTLPRFDRIIPNVLDPSADFRDWLSQFSNWISHPAQADVAVTINDGSFQGLAVCTGACPFAEA